ncbi:LysR substrate-binding domain-containing protein [Reinekea sp. G2M2-21]|uniref:LysR substrate-binding domain-containing protein n=1 Tax=Reinekea sp. G2M2-21 TaxID=2788942 RepID=UPI0018A8F10E|nr:LysR substrate-binding domain-containing protein [Reinekea sp. G2M2-21]
MTQLKLPDLESFRFFEAAARLSSYTRAAEELCVTQAAVSQQIRSLENRLGVKLFQRKGRTMVLSEQGHLILPEVQDGLKLLQLAVRKLDHYKQPDVLSVTMLPSFAARWLVPRLWRFNHRYPDVELRLNPTHTQVDMLNSDLDLAIRLGVDDYPALSCESLMDEYAYAAASPQIAKQIKKPEDVLKFMLIHGWVDSGMNWESWFRKTGVSTRGRRIKKQVINEGSITIEMLLSGHGIAVVRNTLARGLVESGQLVPLLGVTISSHFQYFMIHRKEQHANTNLTAFKHWLREEVAEFTAKHPMEDLFTIAQ